MKALFQLSDSLAEKADGVAPLNALPVLFPDAAECRRLDLAIGDALAGSRARRAGAAVVPRFDRAAFQSELAAFDFASPRKLDAVMDWTVAQLERGMVQITHPRYFGLFNPKPCFPAELADRIAGAFNPQLASATTSPIPVAIEAHVIAAVAARAGLPARAAGHFTSGGSEANRTALVCALTAAHPGFARDGARALPGSPVFYVSREAHLAWIKLAHEVGIGRAAVRLVPTDGNGRLDLAALGSMLDADKAQGAVPVMLVATAGSTGGGALDPLVPLADIADREGLWYHIDAAWAGAAIASDRLRRGLAGLERAHSVTIDAHKWFAATMGCGMFLIADPAILTTAFNVSTSFMPSEAQGLDPYLGSAQWSRRFLGLRLFLALASAGWDGFAAHVERAVSLALALAESLRARGWRVLNDPAFAVVCALPPAGSASPETIAARVLASGDAWVSTTSFAGQTALRVCITNGETTESDIAALLGALDTAREAAPV
jgi:glutamate/tyrosine decarboxylase-like PLP-dependent enzyme